MKRNNYLKDQQLGSIVAGEGQLLADGRVNPELHRPQLLSLLILIASRLYGPGQAHFGTAK